ncbi:hypothetical protein APR41_15775 [Salegentibacter salinarum]|uniref:Glycosyltransferase n=1 Tax=Salegentibacter salinarum TaxID=447422 RepID=A0A2N0TY42_9FLAO|nr:hypothetical protein [Salegentibacter salinarum]PKD19672.1 hypothetical protein APR41_15775 [Salegentibacter salinarum]SKB90668.1 hypothetical protein SAMN05660903_03190 [Salegentibacter salinarum]
MNILFICGCLEGGKDGVGDYVQILAKELLLQQHEVAILAINDPFLSVNEEEKIETILSLRLSNKKSWGSRVIKSREWIDEIKPDHIMWHFVIYGYHPRGFSFRPIHIINKLLKNYSQVSIMFHELWIGAAKEDSIKNKIIGEIHKLIIKYLVWDLKPVKVFTSNSTYMGLLSKEGIPSFLLPIFSNIPYIPGAEILFEDILNARGIVNTEESLKLGIFGTIPFVWQKEKFISQLKKTKSSITLFIAGRSNQYTAAELKDDLKKEIPSLNIIILEEQPPAIISGFLQYIDMGITLTAPQLLEKSGVYAAYVEHGLPILFAGLDKNFNCGNKDLVDDNHHLKWELDGFPEQVKMEKFTPRNIKEKIARNILEIIGEAQSKVSIPLIKM